MAGSYSGYDVPGAQPAKSGQPTQMAFLIWVVLLGVVLPVIILGGLNVGGFKFVFRGRG